MPAKAEVPAGADASAQLVQPLMDLLASSERGQGSATAQTIGKILAGEAQPALQQSASNWFFAYARSPEVAKRRQALFCLGEVMASAGDRFRVQGRKLALELASDPDDETRASALWALGEAIQRGQGPPPSPGPREGEVLLAALKDPNQRVRNAAYRGLAFAVSQGSAGAALNQAAPELLKGFASADMSVRHTLFRSLPELAARVTDVQIKQQAVTDVKARAAEAKSDFERKDWLRSLGELHLALGQNAEAIEAFQRALKLGGGEDPSLNQRLEQALWAAGRGDEVLASPAKRQNCGDVLTRMHGFAQDGDAARLIQTANRALDGYLPTYGGSNDRRDRGEPEMVIGEATRLLLSMKKFDALEEFLNEALKRYPNSPDAWVGQIRLRLAQGQKEQALALCEQELVQRPWNYEALREFEQLCSQMQQLERYETVLRNLVEQHPGEQPLCRPLVVRYVNSDRTNEAQKVVAAYRAAIETAAKEPNDAHRGGAYDRSWQQSALAGLLEIIGDYEGAIVAQRQANESEQGDQRYGKQRLAELYGRAGKTNELAQLAAGDPAVRLQTLQQQIQTQVQSGKFDDALATARLILALDLEGDAKRRAWENLLSAFGNQQGRVATLFEEILRKTPKDTDALRILAGSSCARSDFNRAVEYAERAYTLTPDDGETLSLLASACYQAGRYSRTLELLADALRREVRLQPPGWTLLIPPFPATSDTNLIQNMVSLLKQRVDQSSGYEQADALRTLAYLERLLGHHEAAAQLMQKVLAAARGESSNDRPFVVQEYRLLGKVDEAIEICRQPTAQPWQHPSLQRDLASLYQLKGMTNEANAAFEAQHASWLERIKSGQADAGAYNHVAWAYIQNHVLPVQALELARKGAALAPGDADIGDTLAWALMRNSQFEEALSRFAPALTNRPPNALPNASAWRALSEMAKAGVPEALWTASANAFEAAFRNEPVELARLNLIRSHFHADRGEIEKAEACRRASGYPKESAWLMLGPFSNEQGAGYARAFIPEDQPTVDRNVTYSTSLGPFRWEARAEVMADGVLYPGAGFPGLNWAVAYLTCTVESDREQKAELRLGSDDQAKLWLNGRLIFENPQTRTLTRDQDLVPVELRQGTNHFLVKVCNEREAWAFTLRLTAPGGGPLPGVSF